MNGYDASMARIQSPDLSRASGAAAAADLAGWVQNLTRRVLDQDRRIAELTAEIERLKREARDA